LYTYIHNGCFFKFGVEVGVDLNRLSNAYFDAKFKKTPFMYITDYIDLPNEIYNNQHLCSHNFRKEVCFIYKIYLLLYAKFAISDTILHASTYIFIISSIWLGNQIKVETIFFLIISMQSLDLAFKRGIPRGIHEMIKLVAVLRRIGKVLRIVDAQSPSKRKNREKLPAKITLSNLDVHSRGCKILENVNFEICNGLTVVITGSTASGKSLLLQVILGEYEAVAGRLSINGGISYASQQPWLFASTIRQNILFGTKYNEERYLKVLAVCALLHDLRFLPGGDGFIVDDRGVNLSKGQQSRINLARAVYRDGDIYLLDDCLSNLDVLVGDYIFEKCFQDFLKDKLIILVTQNPRHISGADNVIILNEQTAKFLSISSRHLLQQEIQGLGIAWKKDNSKEKENVTEEDVYETTNLLSEGKLEKNIYEERVISGRINLGSYKKFIAHGGGSVICTVICIVFGVVLITKSSLKKLENNW
jgi:ATP-binding cassette subfamily C (CFTR/MRP) protein 4